MNLFGQIQSNSSFSRCLTMEALKNQLSNNPDYKAYHNSVYNSTAHKNFRIPPLEPVVVPVAFHFSPNVVDCGQINCIIDEVDDQLRILNEAFADNTSSSLIQNCPAAYEDANGNSVVSSGTNISFCYAIPPAGNAQGLDPYCDPPITIGAFNGGTFVSNGVGATGWDGILNIFIIKDDGSDGLGVADGIPGQAIADGVTVYEGAFGGIDGTNCNLGTNQFFNLGYTLVHEVGHYLGLFHTFQGGCSDEPASAGPYNVEDTPPISTDTSGCPAGCVTGCSGPAATANFMDYTNDACMGVFSKDQALVMNLWANLLFGEFQYECSFNQKPSSLNTICNNNCTVICPSIVSNPISIIEEYCGSAKNISFPNPKANGLNLNANSNGEVFTWSVNNYISQGGTIVNEPINLTTVACNVATQTYYLNIDCYNNPLSTKLNGGTYQIQVFPLPPNDLSTLVEITNENNCTEPIVTPVNNCENYVTIIPSNTNPSFPASINESGTTNYTINFTPNTNGPDCCSLPGLGGEILKNGDFELGKYKWLETEEAPPGTTSANPYGIVGVSNGTAANMNGTSDAWLGGYGTNSLLAIEQNIKVPECNTLSLKFDYKTANCVNTNSIELSVYISNLPIVTINCSYDTNGGVDTFGPIDIPVVNAITENSLIRFEAIETGTAGGAVLIDNISLSAKDCSVSPTCSQQISASYDCQDCASNLNLSGDKGSDTDYQVENSIISTATINANITYQAGNSITLNNGFTANKVFDFTAKIGNCN